MDDPIRSQYEKLLIDAASSSKAHEGEDDMSKALRQLIFSPLFMSPVDHRPNNTLMKVAEQWVHTAAESSLRAVDAPRGLIEGGTRELNTQEKISLVIYGAISFGICLSVRKIPRARDEGPLDDMHISLHGMSGRLADCYQIPVSYLHHEARLELLRLISKTDAFRVLTAEPVHNITFASAFKYNHLLERIFSHDAYRRLILLAMMIAVGRAWGNDGMRDILDLCESYSTISQKRKNVDMIRELRGLLSQYT